MRGRVRLCLLAAFGIAFSVQVVVVFLFFPSSSIGSGMLLDESAFPVSPDSRISPTLRASSKTRSASNALAPGVNHATQDAAATIARVAVLKLELGGSAQSAPPVVQDHRLFSRDDVSDAPAQQQKQVPDLSNSGSNYDLVIGINTVARTGNPDYLLRTLRALRAAIATFRERRVFVVVACPVNCSTHSVYSAARLEFETDAFMSFLPIAPSQRFMDPTPQAADPDDHHNPDDLPGKRVRQQTGDVITLLRALQNPPSPPSSYVMMMEDDFLICDGALNDMFRFIDVANSRSQRWMGVRASYGLNGIVLNMRDVPLFESWLAKKISWKPPDILYTEWVAGVEGRSLHVGGIRPYYTAQFNLFEHIGIVSSLRQTGMSAFPGCKADLSPVLWDCEKFKSHCQDISPC